jgi:ribose 5-phosphate isomerase A
VSDLEALKRAAAAKALESVENGMRLGLGTGSTAKHFVDLLGAKVAAGFKVLCVPTSEVTRAQAQSLNIPLTTLDETPALDITIDGADEIDPALTLIKGGGGALLREKIVASASSAMIVIADETKIVDRLGAFALPIEVNVFGLGATRLAVEKALANAGCPAAPTLRQTKDGHVFVTDGGHMILDAACGTIPDAERLSALLFAVPGVVEHGLFIGLARQAIIASQAGSRVVKAV